MKTRIFLSICLLIGAAYWGAGCSKSSADATLAQLPARVQAQMAAAMSAGEVFSYSGTIEESESIPLGFSVLGKVSRVLVAEGDYVRKGKLLAELSGESYKNSSDMTQAMLKQAQDQMSEARANYLVRKTTCLQVTGRQ
jgi:membrane fusion protein, multidrug efflux system